jgi:hypothetical protein
MKIDQAWDEPPCEPDPEPVMAKDNELPASGGVWHAHCGSCCKVTTHSSFFDEHGCDVGSGCNECCYLTRYRGCDLMRANLTTLEEFTASLRLKQPRRKTA